MARTASASTSALPKRVSPDGAAEVIVAVRDYGPGIAAEHIPRLTERFYRIDVTQSRAEGGTGLGLALVKHILNRHRGKLSIESEAGKGATFTVRLPLISQPAPRFKIVLIAISIVCSVIKLLLKLHTTAT